MKSPDSDTPDRERVEQLFHAASELPAAERPAFLARECPSGGEVLRTVDALLAAGRDASTLWDATALEVEARQSAFDSLPASTGETFGPYRSLRRIAAGGMSLVYEAERADAEFHKRVAIKFVPCGIDDPIGAERFRSERQILAQFEHPYIARLLDGGATKDGIPYLVMEYVDGVPIDRFVVQRGLSRDARLRLFLLVCEAVQYAHRNLVVHRDLKPSNILVTADGVPKLLDFGIAKLLQSDSAPRPDTVRAWTPEYASPEQMLGQNIATPSDVYSLGVLLFGLLAERLPYATGADQPADLMRAICEQEPVWEPAGLIRGDLRSILAMALRKEPARRYLSVEQFAADIRRYLDGLPVLARSDAFLYRARKFVTRRAIPLAAAAAILAAVMAGGLSTLAQWRRGERRLDGVRGLAHSVLFDVYDSLSVLPGSLPTRRLLANRAQYYLDNLARDSAGDPSLTRDLAESYLRLGDVLGRPYVPNLGDTTGALENYRKARALLEAEALRVPGDVVIAERLCETYMCIARALTRQMQYVPAIESGRKAVTLAESLSARFPAEPAYREKLSGAYQYLGEAQYVASAASNSLAGFQEVLATYRKSVETMETFGPLRGKSWGVCLKNGFFHITYALWKLGDLTGDASYYRQALENSLKGGAISRDLAEAYPEYANGREPSDALTSIGESRWKSSRDLAGAMRDFSEALEHFQKLAAADPRNLEARRDVANVFHAMGTPLAEAGHRSEALSAFQRALVLYEDVARGDPTSREDAGYITETRSRIAALERSN